MSNQMLTFSKSEVDRFYHNNKSQRWGQAFHNFMKLHKVHALHDKIFCSKLYLATDEVAKAMVASRTDKNQ